MASERRALLVAAMAIFALTGLLCIPGTWARWWLTQDAVEHLAIAHAFASGAGFVDPVAWIHPSEGGVPYPALALRAPMISLFAAIPLASGATLGTTTSLHALFASAVAGLLVFAARRCGAAPTTAFAAALVFATTPAWIGISLHVWTEATALLAWIGVLLTLRVALRSIPGALACALATFSAALCRPNLIALAFAVLVAGGLEHAGAPERRSRSPLFVYAGALAFAWLTYRAAVSALVGELPYSRYSALFTAMTTADLWDYGRTHPARGAFLVEHAGALLDRALATLGDLIRVLFFERTYHGLGWLALPGFAAALDPRRAPHDASGPDAGRLERRFAALSGVGLAATAVLYLDFDRTRFPVFTAAAASLCGFVWLERALARRTSPRLAILVAAALPLMLTLPQSLVRVGTWGSLYRARGTQERLWPEMDARMRPLCRVLEPDALVASVDPWTTHLWCGNASLMLPRDIEEPGILERFLARERPGLLVASSDQGRLRAETGRLRKLTEQGGLVVYAVGGGIAAPRPRTWRGPPPLACAGRSERCVRRTSRPPGIPLS